MRSDPSNSGTIPLFDSAGPATRLCTPGLLKQGFLYALRTLPTLSQTNLDAPSQHPRGSPVHCLPILSGLPPFTHRLQAPRLYTHSTVSSTRKRGSFGCRQGFVQSSVVLSVVNGPWLSELGICYSNVAEQEIGACTMGSVLLV